MEGVEEAEHLATQVAQAAEAAVVEQLLPALGWGARAMRGASGDASAGRMRDLWAIAGEGSGTLHGLLPTSLFTHSEGTGPVPHPGGPERSHYAGAAGGQSCSYILRAGLPRLAANTPL